MANPFPGMDPYLEGDLWPAVHANLATEITRQLVPKLRPKYIALTTQRVTQAVGAAAAAPLIANFLPAMPVPQYGVEIRDPVGRRLVTAVEILSPTNKRGDGRDEYAVKRQELLAGPTHLVEIDLLGVGDRFPVDRPLPSVPYFVFVSRAGRRPQVGIWPIALSAPLPSVPVPLDPGDPDVMLDLQAVLSGLHEAMGYDLSVDYTRPPPGPLSPEDAAWIDQQLRTGGRR
jgi:hypothetical protein